MDALLDPLNEHQRQAVQATHGPVLVLAGAGSGKTRALTHRIAYLIQQGIAAPSEIVAVTFTNKAAREMRERLTHLLGSAAAVPAAVSTFHGLGVRILREQASHHSRSSTFEIFDARDAEKLVREALKEENYSLKEWTPKSIKQQISSAKAALQRPDDIQARQESAADEVLARVYHRYEHMLAEHDAWDFDDLLHVPLELLEEHETLRRTYQARWRFFSVDEYQDTNPLQDRIIHLLLNEERNICAVGDDYQAIYSWRGANVDHILKFEQKHPDAHVVYLTQNYRSTHRILNAANAVIANNEQQKHKELWTERGSGEPVRVITHNSDRDEARWVCDQIRAYQREGGRLSDCAVLYRTNAQSRLLEEQFLTHRVPYTIVGGFRFYDRREVKDALSLLSFFLNPNARVHVERIAGALLRGIGPKTIARWAHTADREDTSIADIIAAQSEHKETLRPLARALAAAQSMYNAGDAAPETDVRGLLDTLLTSSGYYAYIKRQDDGQERLENIEELLNVASGYADPHAFLEDAALLSDLDTMEERADRVTCMTLHAAKGLEFPVIFLVGCEEGLLPHRNTLDSSASIEEERRLVYVGMTRARQRLSISHASFRYMSGEMTPQMPSRFLEDLPEDVERIGAPSEPTAGIQLDTQSADTGEPVFVSAEEGEFVSHPHFGRGVVIGTQGSTLTCVFDGHGVKTIDASSIAS